ncbi:MAG TPA: HAD family hydrolase [Candidatus Bathyarchaeota archaeon]|nr:HAD family hydrolase [Candidatus Bathyarchaeota archaeon]
MRKDSEFYRYVAKQIGVKPSEVLHVGDNLEYDYYEPRKIGMKTLYINREREEVEDVEGIHSLLELPRVLEEMDP